LRVSGAVCKLCCMTTTKHTNCTHPATKAGRAACRNAAAQGITVEELRSRTIQANATVSRRAMIAAKHAAKPEPVDYSTMDYAFETTECDKCFGSGTPGYLPHYAGIYGGVCFSCNKGGNNKTGRKLTRAGAAAKKAHDAWIVEHLSVRLDSLKPGDRFRPSMTEGWRTVVEIDAEPHYAGKMTVGSGDNAVTTEMWHITVTTQKMSFSMDKDRTVIRAASQDERSALIAAIANRKGTILTPKN
jgi:hypothetical protein